MDTTLDLRRPGSLVTLVVFLALVIGVGAVIGISTAPGAWYETLQKPPFNPPNWLFGPVWFALYVLIAIAGWRSWLADRTGLPMLLWGGQMLLNWVWSPVWFGLHQLWPAFAIIVAVLALIVAYIGVNRKRDRVAALLFVPYAIWVAFATLLNLSVAILN